MSMLVGFDSAKIGIFNSFSDEHVTAENIFTIDKTKGGTLGANIQNLNYSPQISYASNVAYRISGKGHGAVTVAFTAMDIPQDLIAKITGATKNAQGIYVVTKDTRAPYCSLMMQSQDADGKKVYLAVLKGQFGFPDRNPQTNNANETDYTDALTFTAIDRLSDGAAYAEGYEADLDFNAENFLDFVFPGADASVAVAGVTLDKTSGTVEVGQTLQLTGTVFPANATEQGIDYESSDPTKATVDAAGLVTGVATGDVVITARSHADSTKQAVANITVTPA